MDILSALNKFISSAQSTESAGNTQKSEGNSSSSTSSEKTSIFENNTTASNKLEDNKTFNIIDSIENELNDLSDFFGIDLNPIDDIREIFENEEDKIAKMAENVSAGEVFEVDGQDGLFIKKESGDYEKLSISSETYKKLFEEKEVEENKSTAEDDNVWEDESSLSDGIDEIFDNPSAKESLLKYFSEDENGNVTFSIPNSELSFTLEAGKTISDYDETLADSKNSIAENMVELALGSSFCTKAIEDEQQWLSEYEEYINAEKDNYSEEFNNSMNDAIDYAIANEIDVYDILMIYDGLAGGESEHEILEYADEKLYTIMKNLPAEDMDKTDVEEYVQSMVWKADSEAYINELKENPYYSDDRNNELGKSDILISLGLNQNGQPISEKAIEDAKQYMKDFDIEDSSIINVQTIASYIDGNERATEIVQLLKNNKEEGLEDYDLKEYLELSQDENIDFELLKKSTELNFDVSVGTVFHQELINEENIDLLLKIQDKREETTGEASISFPELRAFENMNSIISNEKIEEFINNDKIDELFKEAIAIDDILNEYENDGSTRSNLIQKEIDMVFEAALTGQNVEDLAVPTVDSVEKGCEQANVGDVFEVAGEDNIYIKTSDGGYQQLDISKDAYNKLYPPVQKYMSEQGSIGDCFLVSTLNNMMTDPDLRSTLLSCFSENENGDITVDLPNGNYTFTLENGKEISDYEDEQLLSNSSTGMQMLEFCYGLYHKEEIIDELMTIMDDIYIEMESINSGKPSDLTLEECNSDIEEIKNYIKELQEDKTGTISRDFGGINSDVFNAFGITCESTGEEYDLDELLSNPNIKIVSGGTRGNSDEFYLNEELNIAGCHAYTIYPKQQENGEYLFEVINPWDESRTEILTESQIYQYFDDIDFIYLN